MHALPVEYVLSTTDLPWGEVALAVDSGWLPMTAARQLADVRRLDEDPVHSLIWDLAGVRADEPARALLGRIAEREPPTDQAIVRGRWLALYLLELTDHPRPDPLPILEDIWHEFGHPSELNRFIRYMPAEHSELVQKRSIEENLSAMRQSWLDWARLTRPTWLAQVAPASA
ncbi:MAG TPA: DUF2247 family protein [Gemmatimonadales bacterium]|nr:DUF2247 family protein [Gemmatimonadales bacterium]